jgi:hypothetical protein
MSSWADDQHIEHKNELYVAHLLLGRVGFEEILKLDLIHVVLPSRP